ncbi:MAG: DUF2179 domain-containing protein [Candidatus Marinimicrobia bacterium]|nr:DUF2179 domain-containing protein [Candidatus Neomarinimicrobiota bacterium]
MKIKQFILILFIFAIPLLSQAGPDESTLLSKQPLTGTKHTDSSSIQNFSASESLPLSSDISEAKNPITPRSFFFIYILIPILICLARIIDVSLGTLRIILVSKGAKIVAPILGFFESLIWLIAIGQVMQNLTNVINYIFYALGFALGNYIGIMLEQKLALGLVVVRIITRKNASEFIASMKKIKFGLTVIDAHNGDENVNLIFTVIKRTNLPQVISRIRKFNPHAFYSVEDVRSVKNAIFPTNTLRQGFRLSSLFNPRKSK